MQGLSLGNQSGQAQYLRRQREQELIRHLAGQQAARGAYRARYDMLSPLPQQYIDNAAGPGGMDGSMGPVEQIENPDFGPAMKLREALSNDNLPLDVMDSIVGAHEDIYKANRLADHRKQLEERDFSREMSVLEGARKMGIPPSWSKRLTGLAQKYGLDDSWFEPLSGEDIGGVQRGDANSIARYLNRMGSMPPASILPPRNMPGELTADMITGIQSGDPESIAAAVNARRGRSISDLLPKATKSITTPEQAQARLEQFFQSAGGESNFDPLSVAILKDRAARGERFTSSELMGSIREERWQQGGEEAALKYEVEDLRWDMREAEDAIQNALRPKDKEAAMLRRNAARQAYQAKRAELADLYRSRGVQQAPSHTQPAPRGPAPATGTPAPRAAPPPSSYVPEPKPTMTKESAVDQAWNELGPDANPAAVAARARELLGASR